MTRTASYCIWACPKRTNNNPYDGPEYDDSCKLGGDEADACARQKEDRADEKYFEGMTYLEKERPELSDRDRQVLFERGEY
jgi:hypothetical protein